MSPIFVRKQGYPKIDYFSFVDRIICKCKVFQKWVTRSTVFSQFLFSLRAQLTILICLNTMFSVLCMNYELFFRLISFKFSIHSITNAPKPIEHQFFNSNLHLTTKYPNFHPQTWFQCTFSTAIHWSVRLTTTPRYFIFHINCV